jgi:hypothetical protein
MAFPLRGAGDGDRNNEKPEGKKNKKKNKINK